jgi:tetratricopeptide (TPR) repeat protein
MNPAVLKRFIIYLAIATFAMFSIWTIRQVWIDRPPGDYYVEEGGLRLQDKLYDQALEAFDNALKEQPDHRGALMGRAIAFMQSNRPAEAEAEFTYLIKYLESNVQDDDLTGVGALAAAYGNRGILHDRMGRHEKALADYKRALRIDFSSVEGPGIVDRILYSVQPATIEKRAHYIQDQLKLPPEQRVLKNAEIDAKQRMHKP